MKPALIVIDVQNEYFEPHGKSVLPDGQKALVHIQTLLTTFRKLHLPVFHVVHESLSPNALVFRHGSIEQRSILPSKYCLEKRKSPNISLARSTKHLLKPSYASVISIPLSFVAI